MDDQTTKAIAARAFEDGFREGVFARDLHYEIKRAKDAIRSAWFLTGWGGLWLLITAIRITVEPTLPGWRCGCGCRREGQR